jgi:hypothetical protein
MQKSKQDIQITEIEFSGKSYKNFNKYIAKNNFYINTDSDIYTRLCNLTFDKSIYNHSKSDSSKSDPNYEKIFKRKINKIKIQKDLSSEMSKHTISEKELTKFDIITGMQITQHKSDNFKGFILPISRYFVQKEGKKEVKYNLYVVSNSSMGDNSTYPNTVSDKTKSSKSRSSKNATVTFDDNVSVSTYQISDESGEIVNEKDEKNDKEPSEIKLDKESSKITQKSYWSNYWPYIIIFKAGCLVYCYYRFMRS